MRIGKNPKTSRLSNFWILKSSYYQAASLSPPLSLDCKSPFNHCAFQEVYECEVAEDVAVGTSIQRVTASDADEPGTRNSRLEYQLESDEHDMFSIHRRSGQLALCLDISMYCVRHAVLSIVYCAA